MPRQSRIDAPGALHHIIARGIARKEIFRDDTDRENFLDRLCAILKETKTVCYAWALIPNHFHLLLRTGTAPIATAMRRLLTGYAVSHNRRHRRYGHLFQNRYKSILCQEDVYLNETMKTKYALKAQGFDLYMVARRVADLRHIECDRVWAPGKQRQVVEARSLLCYWAVRELGISMASLSRKLNISIPAVSQSVIRGENIAKSNQYVLIE